LAAEQLAAEPRHGAHLGPYRRVLSAQHSTMALLTGQEVSGDITRSYAIHVPERSRRATVPAIVVFNGAGGRD